MLNDGRDRRVTTQVTTQNFPGESPIVYGVAYPPPARGRAWWRSENILEKSRGMGFSHGTFAARLGVVASLRISDRRSRIKVFAA